ncbi:hypothetical protein [Bradyrhizobium uaiense]|uniref:hypothetical protein n=1 Tax=Bradyrhizobium uaiense TaxID=2594946 RepID=UPI0013D09716|nr:hypothetical protein [Bradyrhizobium uaiense]
MRITSKVHASWMPAADPLKIKGITQSVPWGAGFLLGNPQPELHAIRAIDCFCGMIERRSRQLSRRIRGNGGARRHQQDG